jgi:small GTP-binding protein
MMKKLVVGILAHVDAGKTTLSESMLYLSGKIRKLGRVDNQDAYLDTYELERARGITIFSKQALFDIEDTLVMLLDTPGHVDFSAEMERTLQVLDYAILVVSGADGVQGHTKTLWRLLDTYQIPTFLFINKMDQQGIEKSKVFMTLKNQLDEGCIDFTSPKSEEFYDQIALCDEALLEEYLETGEVAVENIKKAIQEGKVFPCFFGSALRLEGIETFMQGIIQYTHQPFYPTEFGAKVFKITRDGQGNRLTHMKITGGSIKVKDLVSNGEWEGKVNQIRLYSGEKYEAVGEVGAGSICAVTGLTQTKIGEGLGIEQTSYPSLLEPVLSYQIRLPEDYDPRVMLPKLKELEEEEPTLRIIWNEELQEIQAQIMGEVQIEILQSLIQQRFQVDVTFGEGKIVYKETIENTVEGVGHFEPLRHYAEVHLLLEPAERGSGVQLGTLCSEDVLSKNWQRLVLSHLDEKVHKGVLTGSGITDLKITLVSGRAHNKHTEGGDFREATYRAVRQGLKQAESILLEPYYHFQLEVPEKMVGRAMTDIDQMKGTCEISKTDGEMATILGIAPVVTMRNYHKEVISYTKGHGRLFCTLKGYERCHNTEEVIQKIGYDSERDLENPTGSVFCAHGSGFLVPWDEVEKHMHLEGYLKKEVKEAEKDLDPSSAYSEERSIGLDEIDQILHKTAYSNQGRKSAWKKQKSAHQSYYQSVTSYVKVEKEPKEEYLLVDGYNIIFAWEELKELTNINMDGAKIKLLDTLSNYQGIKKCKIIVVFDAYRVEGHAEEVIPYHNIHMVYTKEAQTADQYIEKFAHTHSKKYQITVATSDGLQQIIIRGAGCQLLSARELEYEVKRANQNIQETYRQQHKIERTRLKDSIGEDAKQQLEALSKSKLFQKE